MLKCIYYVAMKLILFEEKKVILIGPKFSVRNVRKKLLTLALTK